METRCHNCGTPVGVEQAFCPKCGAVVGMADSGKKGGDEGWDMATTMVGPKKPSAPPRTTQPRPAPPELSGAGQARPSGAAQAHPPRPAQAAAPQQQAPRGGNTVLLAVIGIVAVLLIGGLAFLLLYLNSRG